MMAEPTRARSIDEFLGKVVNLTTESGLAYARAFTPRAEDIIIATYSKAGTTWMQQIVHGLRTGGDMNFSEITEVIPWILLAHDLGLDLAGEQRGHPRAFKSHQAWDEVAKGCRYIYVVRDPKDSALSFYNFMNGWFLEADSVSLDTFIEEFYVQGYLNNGYWPHLLSWWPVRNNPEVLYLCYENMREDLPGTVKAVADFIGVDEPKAIDIATSQATFEFMNAHNRQFDDHLITNVRNAPCGLPVDAVTSKVKTGRVGGSKQLLSAAAHALLDSAWEQTITPELGFINYAELRAALTGQVR